MGLETKARQKRDWRAFNHVHQLNVQHWSSQTDPLRLKTFEGARKVNVQDNEMSEAM